MNNKGFTLVELLVVIVIMGVIMGMSWPVINRIQENNEINKYEKYGEALMEAAKLYVDSYEEDLFYYDDDLDKYERERGQCAYITYNDLKDHLLIKDFNNKGMTCNSESTFVRVVRKKGKYKYNYYLGCGYKKADGSQLKNDSNDIFYTYPDENAKNYQDPAVCSRIVSENEPPTISYIYIYSSGTSYNGKNVYLYFTGFDNDTERPYLRYCVSESQTTCDEYVEYGDNTYTSNYYYTFDDENYDGREKTLYVHLKDASGNITVKGAKYRYYKQCTSLVRKNEVELSACDKACGTGQKKVKYDLYDRYLNVLCGSEDNVVESCNTVSCCSKVRRVCDDGEDIDSSQCDNACVGSTKLQFAICDSVSAYTGESCGISTRELQFVSCNSTKECNSTNFLYNPTFRDNNSGTPTRVCETNPNIGEVRCSSWNGQNYLYSLSVTGISTSYARIKEKVYDIKTGEILCEKNKTISGYNNCMDTTKYRKNVIYVGYIYDNRDTSKTSTNTYYQLLESDGIELIYGGQ